MVNNYLVLFVSGFWFCGRTMARPYFFLYVYRTRHAVSLLGCFLFDRLFFISRFFVGT